jgi:SAM-dependent methyltransferase
VFAAAGIGFLGVSEPDFLSATRASYDAVAADYYKRYGAELDDKPLDRAMLAGFAELVRTAGAEPVADIGCGTGRVAALLDGLGVSAFGIDPAGFVMRARMLREPDKEGEFTERTQQAFSWPVNRPWSRTSRKRPGQTWAR